MFRISDEDIKNVERLLLPENATFCEESRAFICTEHSVDVQACPGSGKTTALLAKLLILASRLPLPNNAGICVLTHTNTAINEVKRRFGQQTNKLFQYPNFVGTIQSFVNKFLATPAFIELYGNRPVTIDDGQFYFEIQRSQRDIQSAKYFLKRNRIELKNLRFSFDGFVISKSLNDNTPFVRIETSTYIAVEQHKRKVLEKGYLCFDDAYALANQYLNRHKNISDLFTKRFQYIFIDEMQDTDVHQSSVLNTIFQPEKTVVQCIGDQNQAIYSYAVREDIVWKPSTNILRINGSKRFSTPIAQAIKGIGLQPQELVGDAKKPLIKPILLFFDDNQITSVIPYFCTLIEKYDLQSVTLNPVFKAIGWTGKEYDDNDDRVGKHRLGDYWPQYSSERMKKKLVKEHLCEYLVVDPRSANPNSAKLYRDAIVEAVLKYLAINNVTRQDGRSFTSSKLFDFLQVEQSALLDHLMINLAKWVRQLVAGIDIHDEIMFFLVDEMSKCKKFNFKLNRV